MRRVFCICALIVMLLTMLTACGGSFKCDLCNEEKSGKKHTKEILGEEIVYCDDCADGLNQIAGMFS